MIFPFVNWFWKPKKNSFSGFEYKITPLYKEFMDLDREYNSRLGHFEGKLDEFQWKEYMDLKLCANRLLIAKDRLDFANEHNNEFLMKMMK